MTDSTIEPPAVALLRGPLSKRATSAEFNEWQAREVADYIDHLHKIAFASTKAQLEAQAACDTAEAALAAEREAMKAADYLVHRLDAVTRGTPVNDLDEAWVRYVNAKGSPARSMEGKDG